MEYSQVEKNPFSTASTLLHNGIQEGTHRSSKSTTVLSKNSSQVENQLLEKDRSSKRSDDMNVALNLCPDGSKINISINGTTITATKTSLNATIGSFTISINCHDPCTLIKEDEPLPPVTPVPREPISVALASFIQQNPVHIAPVHPGCVRATLSLTQVMSDPNAYLVNVTSDGQGGYYLSANNTYYVAIDLNNNIQPLLESEISNTNMYTFRQEEVTNAVDKVRYYLEIDGNRYYLTVTSAGDVRTLHADDLITGSLNDLRSRFRHMHE